MQKNDAQAVILFDGTCMLCDTFVNFIKKIDHNKKFKFEPYQSEYGKQFHHLFVMDENGTVGLVLGEKILIKSDAAITVMKILGRPWSALYLLIYIPKFIRDSIYNFIAKHRYKLFGRKEYCEL
jgi:predicted DCC family thiol-disulfide oxidoreductase YuxK